MRSTYLDKIIVKIIVLKVPGWREGVNQKFTLDHQGEVGGQPNDLRRA